MPNRGAKCVQVLYRGVVCPSGELGEGVAWDRSCGWGRLGRGVLVWVHRACSALRAGLRMRAWRLWVRFERSRGPDGVDRLRKDLSLGLPAC